MSNITAILLGIVQGITEFLPVSSTAHIIILEHLLGISFPGLSFEVLLHFASLIALMIYFYKDIINLLTSLVNVFIKHTKKQDDYKNVHYVCLLLITTFITGIIGILIEKILGDALKTLSLISVSLMVTSVCLIYVEYLAKKPFRNEKNSDNITILDAIIVGVLQALSVIPGISRSGSSLFGGLLKGFSHETSLRYTFLLSFPVIISSTVLKIPDLIHSRTALLINPHTGTVAFVSAIIASILGIKWLIALVQHTKLTYFSVYIFIISIITLFSAHF